MNSPEPIPTTTARGWSRSRRMAPLAGVAVVIGVIGWLLVPGSARPTAEPLPVRPVTEIALPGDSSSFDYASLDPDRGLLFIAHLGASEVIEVDIRAGRVLRTLPNLSGVHGVLVVPALHRVYASATDANLMVTLDEDTGAVLNHAPTGDYPDGLAYDPRRGTIWTTNESGGSETVIDAATSTVRGTVDLGGDVGNVAYDPVGDQMLVPVQGRGDLAVIDPATLAVIRRVALPGCQGGHGLALDPTAQVGFIGCEGNATLATLDLTTWRVTGTYPVGNTPDVLAYDPGTHRLYVAAEDGTLSVLDQHDRGAALIASRHLADGAHVVAIDPTTHRGFYPIPRGADGHPALLEQQPVP